MSTVIRTEIGAFPHHLCNVEAQIINRYITEILKRGLAISVFDGEEFSVKRSRDRKEIQKEVAATDVTEFRVRDADGNMVAWFQFIHGNHTDVMSNCTANDLSEEIDKAVRPTIERLEGLN